MRKFNGLLLVSDFDNTLVYTEEALQKCVDMPPVSDENRAAIEYFMANGGIFSVATGRAKPAFEAVAGLFARLRPAARHGGRHRPAPGGCGAVPR